MWQLRAPSPQENDTKRTRAEKKFIEEEKKKEEHTLAIEEYKAELEKLKVPDTALPRDATLTLTPALTLWLWCSCSSWRTRP